MEKPDNWELTHENEQLKAEQTKYQDSKQTERTK